MSSNLLGADMMDSETSGSQISPSKKLQHAILQLCNEYITYDRTLQVLGVICLTIDDQQPEIVVKVNNTLKRFKEPDSINLINSLQKADAKAAKLLNISLPQGATQDDRETKTFAKTSSSHGSGLTKSKMGLRSGKLLRKGHGRKQSKPSKVSHAQQSDFANEHSSNDEISAEKSNDVEPDDNTEPDDDSQKDFDGAKDAVDEESVNARSRKRPLEDIEPLDENLAKLSKLPHDELEFQEIEDASALLDAESDEDLKRLVIIEPLENNVDDPNQMNESTMPSFDAALANLSEVDLQSSQKLQGGDIIHIKEEPVFLDDEHLGSTELERLLKADKSKPKQKNVLEASQYQVESRVVRTVTPVARQLLPAPSALLSNQIFAILPNTANVQPQNQTGGLARLLQPTTFYTVTDKNVQSSTNNCFSLQLTQMAKNVLKLPENASRTVTNQIPIIKSPSSSQGSTLVALNRQPNNESDYLLDSFAAEPELLTKIGLKSSSLNTDPGISKKTHRRRIYEDVLTPEEIVEYVGSTDETASSAALQRPYKCNCCDKTLHNLLEYFRHTLKVHNAFVCHQCGKDFSTKSSLLRHRPIHTGLRRFACGICQKSFYRKDKCKSHIKMHFRFGFPATAASSSSGTAGAALVQSGITTQFVSLPTFVVPTSEGTTG